MKTSSVPTNGKPAPESIRSSESSNTALHPASDSVPRNSAEFHAVPRNSTGGSTQILNDQSKNRKSTPGTFAGKISPEQRYQLFEWLADHTYDEVVELVAVEPPDGFGIKVGKTTICRFYKAHFNEIDKLRQSHLEERAVESIDRQDGNDYRAVVRDAYTQLLLERLWELLSRPVQSADELKKLTVIAEKMKNLDRDKEIFEEAKAKRRDADLNKLLSTFRPAPNPA